MAIYRTTKLFSKSLPPDWDSDDDKYVRMVEKAKSRNRKIARIGPYIAPTVYGAAGAAMGGTAGMIDHGPKGAVAGSVLGAAIGAGTAWATQEAIGRKLRSKGKRGQDKESFKKLSKSDQKAANRALGHYRNLKTKEERLAWRKKIGSRV